MCHNQVADELLVYPTLYFHVAPLQFLYVDGPFFMQINGL